VVRSIFASCVAALLRSSLPIRERAEQYNIHPVPAGIHSDVGRFIGVCGMSSSQEVRHAYET